MLMKRFKLLLVLFFILIASQILPQEKLFTAEDVILSGQRLSPQNLQQLSWSPNTSSLAWSGKKPLSLFFTINTSIKLSDLNTLFSAQNEKSLVYYSYISHGHGVAGGEALYLYTKTTNYFLDNL